MMPRNFFTKQGITLSIFGTVRYILDCRACHSYNGIFFSKIYHHTCFPKGFAPINLLVFRMYQSNNSLNSLKSRKCEGVASPELCLTYDEKVIKAHHKLNFIMDQLSSKKKVIQQFFKRRKHLNFK